MVNPSTKLAALPTRIDRYPAKMVGHLATTLIDRYAANASHIVDPFCGSGAVLRAGSLRGFKVSGVDINPFGVLLSRVKLQGFCPITASDLCDEVVRRAYTGRSVYPVSWDAKGYWFSPATIQKYERIRFAAREMALGRSKAGRAVLLALGLSVRCCSRADQRSPKPFISKYARQKRAGRHFDPATSMQSLLHELTAQFGLSQKHSGVVVHGDIRSPSNAMRHELECSHVITSPPYINAQDYFRNSKLELYLLEGVLPYRVEDIIPRFVGTERGVGRELLSDGCADARRRLCPDLRYLEKSKVEQAAIVHRYLHDMERALQNIRTFLEPGGVLVLVCGDNLIGGRRICTWAVLNEMVVRLGFRLFDSFGDPIRNRAVAPWRCGHKGIIKQETISAFRLDQISPRSGFGF